MGETEFALKVTSVTPGGSFASFLSPNPNRVCVTFGAAAAGGTTFVRPTGFGLTGNGIPLGSATVTEFYYSRHGPLPSCGWECQGTGAFTVIEILLNLSNQSGG